MGVPVITSTTPSYERTMKKADLDMTCLNKAEWLEMLDKYIMSEESRQIAGIAGRKTANENYSENETLRQWDEVFQSIF